MLHIKHKDVERVFPADCTCNRVGLSITVERDKELLFLAPCVEVSHVYHDTEDTPPEKSGSLFKSQRGGAK